MEVAPTYLVILHFVPSELCLAAAGIAAIATYPGVKQRHCGDIMWCLARGELLRRNNRYGDREGSLLGGSRK